MVLAIHVVVLGLGSKQMQFVEERVLIFMEKKYCADET